MRRKKSSWAGKYYLLTAAQCMFLLLSPCGAALPGDSEGTQRYKMLSCVEYTGKTQFRNQVETLLTLRRELLSDDAVRYFISSRDFDLLGSGAETGQEPSSPEISFIIDRNTGRMWGSGKDLALLEKINNECVKSLKKVTSQNIGKTWKQSFKLAFLEHLMPGDVTLTLTAIKLNTKAYGQVMAVRALSEPFVIKAATEKRTVGDVKAKIGAVYLFDQKIEDIYLSIYVFEAGTDMNGAKEKLRHEVAAYMTDAQGASADLTGLGATFAKFVRPVGLSNKSAKVSKKAPLPGWARSAGVSAAQVANICAGTACEGASNPTATHFVPAARTVGMQSLGVLGSVGTGVTISSALTTSVTGIAGAKIAAAPAFMGMGLGTAGAIAGGTTAIAVGAGGGGGGSSARSPSTP